MGFAPEPCTSDGLRVVTEDDREDGGLGDWDLRMEGAVWKEATEET
jgi:hypothetical protein